ncbi:MAG TPA: dienelactone hydrolase family protein [Acidimicrobiales bacterium]|jgi:carboxymethylenebutenolidase|nr:dienelactone hydrolase family protein [Acidimicrobiales bacterium]
MSKTPLTVHRPDGEALGGVLVIQEAFGINDHIASVCRRFAAAGYVTVAPHLFHRSGDPKLGYEDFSLVMPHMQALTAESVLEDVDEGLNGLAGYGLGPPQIGVVGFCMGGTVALVTDALRDVGAAVSFYGGGVTEGRFGFPSLVELAPTLRAPWLGLYGDQDQGIPVGQVEELRAAAAKAPVPTEVVRYPEAEHGFHCDVRASYHAVSAQDAWARTLAWFERYLGGIE